MAYRELATTKPFIVNKNLGSAVEVEPEELTRANADGLPVVVPTQKQKYDFDRNGWLLIPSVLSDAEIGEMREFCERLRTEPDGLPEPERCALGGPLQKLADHPNTQPPPPTHHPPTPHTTPPTPPTPPPHPPPHPTTHTPTPPTTHTTPTLQQTNKPARPSRRKRAVPVAGRFASLPCVPGEAGALDARSARTRGEEHTISQS